VRYAPGSDSTDSRERRFEAERREKHPEIQIVAEQYCMSDRARALTVSENMLNGNPALDAFFCSSEAALIGAARAVCARNLMGQVPIVGFDASPTLQKDLRDGIISALVVQDPFRIGYTGVKTIVQKRNGESPPRQIELPARVVRAADLNDPEIQRLAEPYRRNGTLIPGSEKRWLAFAPIRSRSVYPISRD